MCRRVMALLPRTSASGCAMLFDLPPCCGVDPTCNRVLRTLTSLMRSQLFAGSRVDGAVVEAFTCLRCAPAPVCQPAKQLLLLRLAQATAM